MSGSRYFAALMLSASLGHSFASDNVNIVDWDGSGVESQQPLNLDSVPKKVSATSYNLLFDESASWLPAEGYSLPPSDKTGSFSLAISSSAGDGPAQPKTMELARRSGGGTLTIMASGSLDLPPRMCGLLIFGKKVFLNGADQTGKKVHFNKESRLSFLGILDGLAPEAHWLVRDNETWYVSEAALQPQTTYSVSEPRELVDPEGSRWVEYSIDTPLSSVPSSFAKRTFENITAIGIIWDSYGDRPVLGATSISRMAVDAFSADAEK